MSFFVLLKKLRERGEVRTNRERKEKKKKKSPSAREEDEKSIFHSLPFAAKRSLFFFLSLFCFEKRYEREALAFASLSFFS